MIRQIELKTTGSSSFDSAKCFRFIENKNFWRSRYDDEILRNDVDFSQNERAKKAWVTSRDSQFWNITGNSTRVCLLSRINMQNLIACESKKFSRNSKSFER